MKSLWALRHAFGAILSFGLGIALMAGAVLHYPMYVGIAVLVLIVWMIATLPRVRREREKTKNLIDAAFRDAYFHLSNPPSMKISSSYGYPAFEIVFGSKAERDRITAQNEVFKCAIDEIYIGYGPSGRPFCAEQAIFFTYDDYRNELRANYRTA